MVEKKEQKTQLNAQYVKDLSFENPNSPMSLTNLQQQPQINFNIDIKANKLNDDNFEVIITVNAEAKSSKEKDFVIFLVELKYAGLFSVAEKNEDKLKKILLVECPTILFPYARRIISDSTRDGGFPALMMEPINFEQLFEKNNKNLKKKTIN